MYRTLSALVAALILAAAPAFAGIADSPLPVLVPGKKTLHLYSVLGVINSGSVQSFFSCTSTDTATMQVAVEIFNEDGSSPSSPTSESFSLPQGASVTFRTGIGGGSAFNANKLLFTNSSSFGSARILATSKKLACTAFLVDTSQQPLFVAPITIIAKTKQKAAN
jgi:hypothetical protein